MGPVGALLFMLGMGLLLGAMVLFGAIVTGLLLLRRLVSNLLSGPAAWIARRRDRHAHKTASAHEIHKENFSPGFARKETDPKAHQPPRTIDLVRDNTGDWHVRD